MPVLAPPAPPAPETVGRRAEATASTSTELMLALPDGETTRVVVEAVREKVAECADLEPGAPALAVGQVLEARLRLKGLGRPLLAVVRVIWRNGAGESRRYGLALPALGQRGGALTAALCAAFNRRSTQRVRPEPLTYPLVTLQGPDGRLARGPLSDISLGGLSLRVGAEAEAAFAAIDDVRLTLTLPHEAEPLQLAAQIRSRRLEGSQVRYGLQFGPTGRAKVAVLDYVRRRRVDCLRRAERTQSPELI